MAFRLNVSETRITACPETEVPDHILPQLKQDLEDLAKGKPEAHLLGTMPFLDWEFKCDARALIPRPETEYLCDLVRRRRQSSPPKRILDLCCGSGVMGLSLACSFPDAELVLTDIDEAALELCRENVALLGCESRTNVFRGDLWAALPPETQPFDLILSNPPYVAKGDDVGASVLDWEPHLALFSDDSGMGHITRILSELADWINPNGTAAFELGHYHQNLLQPQQRAPQLDGVFTWEPDPYDVSRYLIYRRSPRHDK